MQELLKKIVDQAIECASIEPDDLSFLNHLITDLLGAFVKIENEAKEISGGGYQPVVSVEAAQTHPEHSAYAKGNPLQ